MGYMATKTLRQITDAVVGACSVAPRVLWADDANKPCCLGGRLGDGVVSVQIKPHSFS